MNILAEADLHRKVANLDLRQNRKTLPVPASADEPQDLAGKRLQVEFSGDGDDANLCFLGMDGLLGAKDAWLTFDSVDGDRVAFTMSGSFDFYDGDGGMGSARQATARGDAQITEIYQ